ncbi:MAG: helix-turn-helix transcriptional regulator [Lachnospiraceae bacterium]|nr:helix-turn-helix transcriptional regulator [Lachnospiraceae bacterium]
MKLNEKIIYSRKKTGMSQIDLADVLGVSRQTVSKWETGESNPEIGKLPVLSKALNVSIDWLLSDEDVPMEYTNEERPQTVYVKDVSTRTVKPGRAPSALEAVMCVVAGIIGIFWLGMAITMGAPVFFPIFGILFIGIAVVGAVYSYRNATAKNRYSLYDIMDADQEKDPFLEELEEIRK